MRTLTKIAPKPRAAAGAGVVLAGLGTTKLKSMPLSLNIAKVLLGLNAPNFPAVFGLTEAKPMKPYRLYSSGRGRRS